MYLKHIYLRDWKAYVDAKMDFPPPGKKKNVILVGAKNGYGKTSLFEAIVLGLFGRDGLPLIARAPFSGAGEEKLQISYNEFLSGALHRSALREGRTSASIELAFHDDDEGPIILRRIWHFTASGNHKPQDEEVRIYAGKNERPIAAPPGEDRSDWLRAYIAKQFLPNYLAAFFLFDGEQVQALASRDMSAQVRLGIEGLLGIPVLRELAEDLRKYADNRRYSFAGASDDTIRRVQGEILALEGQESEAKQRLEQLIPSIDALRVRRDALTRELSSYGSGSEALLRERLEEVNRNKRALEELFEQLYGLLSSGIAMALTGPDLRQQTVDRLRQEEIRENWEAGRSQGNQGLSRFLATLESSFVTLLPPLQAEQHTAVMERVEVAWESLWHPAPEGCADDYRHPYLKGGERAQARNAIVQAGRLSTDKVSRILSEIAEREADKRRIEAEIAQTEGIGPQIDGKVAELRGIGEEIEKLAGDKGRVERDLEGVRGQISAKRQELARLARTRDAAAPAIRRAERADKAAATIDAVIKDAVPGQIAAVAAAMTQCFKAMAHKTIVNRVEITPECEVRLLSRSGNDLREMDLSAGEQQIFAQALIAAVAQVSDRDFPIMIDTPLARLDDDHRSAVLRHFIDRAGQVILLSTDTEVVGPYLDIVRPRVSQTYRIHHDHDGDIGRSRPINGYFTGTGI